MPLVLAITGLAQAQEARKQEEPLTLRRSKVLTPPGSSTPTTRPAVVLGARKLESRLDQEATAEGDAELRYGELLLKADKLSYLEPRDEARATGHVEVSRAGNVFRGSELQLFVQRFEGEFLDPSYFFSLTGGGGKAARLRFLGEQKVLAEGGTYSSCPAGEDGQEPAWELRTTRLRMDFEANEGIASGAVLRFYGVPILAAPTISFALGSARKSGWLPPNIGLDNRSGFELGLPYYWNIAPQHDATFTPFVMTRRGAGVDSEFRYLEPQHNGVLNLAWLPSDRVANRARWALDLAQQGEVGRDWRYQIRSERVSDDEYWKDLPKRLHSQTPRLLATDLRFGRTVQRDWGEAQAYARVQSWQALQGADPLSRYETPYQRLPQVGLRLTSEADDAVMAGFRPWGRRARLEGSLELEYNRFELPREALLSQIKDLPTGQRAHALGHVSVPLGGAGWWLIPKLSLNAAAYSLDAPLLDGRRSMSRSVPSFSVDQGWVFERQTELFGRGTLQTLEPRLLYVNTPYRAQLALPNFDSAPKDFNFDSIYTDNQFSGIDRVSDNHQLTFGAISRWVNASQGGELLRLGLVQRYLFRDQRITPDGQPQTQRLSDLLLLGSAHLNSQWWMDAAVQYNPDSSKAVRTVMSARYSPGPYRTVSAAYRLAAGQSEQVELGWQWPLFGAKPDDGPRRSSASSNGSGSCSGAWYSAGRVQYSLKDKRFTDSVVGFEYDAGCWILRVGAERLSTGRAETNTRLLLQLELVGLSRLGSNALKVLRDNIPGYRPLSSDRSASSDASYD
ncbi:LPS assembly protein LptD [Pelomonas sp. SE-A7]|uniref:LPS-assembly protein LptD n=1 Tax=Pelomonas sp. SE-A7 TaxID=3054953 RepID=UPI00259CBA7B|nr:LPS assembly protein LptD [Pelomonas sp. SE-A7]MDM4766973.1 LPS assembly protein LptD [Pelomonas sp. SE-A7]